jgi:hypothetical protein
MLIFLVAGCLLLLWAAFFIAFAYYDYHDKDKK